MNAAVTRCLLLSIALHAAVFAWWPHETPLAVPPPAWVLLAAETETPAAQAVETVNATVAAASGDVDEPRETAPSAEPATEGDTPDIDAGPAMLALRLRDALAARFVYPALARREGWQGEGKVGVRVNADGRLSDIHLVASSGHAVLD